MSSTSDEPVGDEMDHEELFFYELEKVNTPVVAKVERQKRKRCKSSLYTLPGRVSVRLI